MKLRPLSYLLFILFAGVVVLSSCDDIIEPSISKSQVKLEAPADKDTSSNYTINFWWDQVNHALSYHLQIVSRTFAAPGNLVLDTMITKTQFSFNLSPGNYQWRIIAENGSSQTAYTAPRSLTIVPSSLKQQSVLLISPASNFFTNQSAVIFSWNNLYGANQYRFELDTNNFADPSTIVSNTLITGQQISFSFPKAQVYQWRVQAQNDTAQAQWSVVNTITFNNIPPAQVTLTSPANGQTLSQPVALQWNAVTNALKYKLYAFKSDSTTLYNSNFPLIVSSTSYNFSQGVSGDKIYWKVSAIDAEGNVGKASLLGNFTLQ
jgi:hypothetical protein